MHIKQLSIFGGVMLLLMLTACGATPAQPTNTVSQKTAGTPPTDMPTLAPTRTPVEEAAKVDTPTSTAEIPTATPTEEMAMVELTEELMEAAPTEVPATVEPTPTAEEINWLTVEGKTEDKLTYLGNPDAPITIIDYSDFM